MPRINPDYTGLIIPPNIAPLNFRVFEPLDQAVLKIASNSGDTIHLKSHDGTFRIPIKAWKRLLNQNRGQSLTMQIHLQKDGQWQTFRPIVNRIAKEPIDPYLAYRLINPAYSLYTVMGLYQRNLETFEQKPILVNRLTQDNCMNCHNFKNNDPAFMLMHLRGGPAAGTLIQYQGEIHKVNTATEFNKAGAYPSWHPNGNIIAFSVNTLTMFFHAVGESRDVLDSGSDLVLYWVDKNMITTGPGIANPERMETFPCWSPDGRYLYFCAADKLERYVSHRNGKEDLLWETIRYDLMRIAYNAETNTWGQPETVLSAYEADGSITMPRISPDGRFLMFTKAAYGNFPVYLKSADLYLIDLKNMEYKPLECNSDQTESFHSWSSNGRWFVFSSKRQDGFCARPFFSYLNQDGIASKPFLLPQEDPAFYDEFLKTYNVPELIREPIQVNPRTWARVALETTAISAKLDPLVKVKAQPSDKPDLYQKARR
ncbi:MAG: cytochrome C biosynthesis protein [candidate division KSB1 bacterium]|nr:cytochrome C biosynthesis protein [candidate division KSB1 bacterium]